MHSQLLVILFTVMAVGTKVSIYITNPLYLDSLNGNNSHCAQQNTTVDPYFASLSLATFYTIGFGAILLVIVIFRPEQITHVERNFPKKYYVIAGASTAVSSLLLSYASSGTRTPSYLLALLGNFMVPSQFIIRFFLLRKMPTRRKLLCAVAVMVAEFICLLPKIVPALDPDSESSSGGASGAAGVLWPLSFVIGLIPGTLNNAYIERALKKKQNTVQQTRDDVDSETNNSGSGPSDDFTQVNVIFFLFWYSVCVLLTLVCLVWTDLIPGYSTVSSIKEFGHRMAFNTMCIFGQGGCDYYVVTLAWATIVANWLAILGGALLIKYSEGASFMIIAQTLRSPFIFLFWTLFKEGSAIKWHPHFSLSTILGIVALVVMVPSVHLYNTGDSERTIRSFRWGFWREENWVPVQIQIDSSDQEVLINAEDTEGVNSGSQVATEPFVR